MYCGSWVEEKVYMPFVALLFKCFCEKPCFVNVALLFKCLKNNYPAFSFNPKAVAQRFV